jgi:hypothetical protein
MGVLVFCAAEALLVWTFDTYRVVFAGYYISECKGPEGKDGDALVVIREQAASRRRCGRIEKLI